MKCVSPSVIWDITARMLVPCGKCITCRRRTRKAHAGRLIAEAQEYPFTSALCLSLDPRSEAVISESHNPEGLFKDMVMKWRTRMERAAQRRGEKAKFDIMIERGDVNLRLHAHVIAFGVRYKLRNNAFADISDWPYGHTHQMHLTAGNIHYHAGHQNSGLKDPIWRTRTQLAHGSLNKLAMAYASAKIQKPVLPWWRLGIQGKTSLFPWSIPMSRLFYARVEDHGWRKPPLDICAATTRADALSANEEYLAELDNIEAQAIAYADKLSERAAIRRSKRGSAL